MDVNELAQTIVRQVLQGLQAEEEKACVMVLGRRDPDVVHRVEKALDKEVDIVFLGEETGHSLPTQYILPCLMCGDMADLAAGKAQGEVMQKILNLLLAGVEILVLDFEYRAYKETAPGALYRLYAAYEETLASFGLRVFESKKQTSMRCWQKLVTEAMVTQAAAKGTKQLLVPYGTVITPLAVETAKALHVNISKRL